MPPRQVPSYPLQSYAAPGVAELGLMVERFEILETTLKRTPGVHRHEHFELFWLQGPAVHVNDFERYTLPEERPSFILVSPGQMHVWEGTATITGTMISFTEAFFDGRQPPPSALLDFGFVHRTAFPPALVADDRLSAEVQPLVARCEQEFAAREGGWTEVIRASLRLLLTSAQRAYTRSVEATTGAPSTQRLVQRFRALIEADFRTQNSVSAYAQKLGITAGHLNDMVRALTGGTAGELIRARVVLEAQRLLSHSELSVSEIAYHLGFEDPSYFAKLFRRTSGRAPVDFRTAFRENYPTARK